MQATYFEIGEMASDSSHQVFIFLAAIWPVRTKWPSGSFLGLAFYDCTLIMLTLSWYRANISFVLYIYKCLLIESPGPDEALTGHITQESTFLRKQLCSWKCKWNVYFKNESTSILDTPWGFLLSRISGWSFAQSYYLSSRSNSIFLKKEVRSSWVLALDPVSFPRRWNWGTGRWSGVAEK